MIPNGILIVAMNKHSICILLLTLMYIFPISSESHYDIGFLQRNEGGVSLSTFLKSFTLDSRESISTCSSDRCEEDVDSVSVASPLNALVFSPSTLDFGEVQVGFPREVEVVLTNERREEEERSQGDNKSEVPTLIKLLSLSVATPTPSAADNPQYLSLYPTFFTKKHLEPGESTLFTVTYLPKRSDESLDSTVYVHTQLGSVRLRVRGRGVGNSYKLESIHSPVVPVNTSFETDITLYNPYPMELNITQLYSSGPNFHLEPIQDNARSWTLSAFETKSVMRTSFFSTEAANHTGFLKLILETSQFSDSIILPIRFQSSEEPGVYANTDTLDFGQTFPDDQPKSLDLLLINTYMHDVTIQSVTSRSKAMKVNFIGPQILPAKMQRFNKVASFHLIPNSLNTSKDSCGEIVIRLSGAAVREFKIPFRSKVLIGNLTLQKNISRLFHFYSGSEHVKVQKITVKNNFQETLLISRVYLHEKKAPDFSLEGFQGPVKIEAGQTARLGSLRFTPRKQSEDEEYAERDLPSYHAAIHVSSNISDFSLPFSCYSGQLKFEVECAQKDAFGSCVKRSSEQEFEEAEEEELDFGFVTAGSHKSLLLRILNTNSVPVEITEFKWTVEDTNVSVVTGKFRFDGGILQHHHELLSEEAGLPVKQGKSRVAIAINDSITLRVTIQAPVEAQLMGGHLFIKTKYQSIQMKMHYQTLVGSITAKKLMFRSFPFRTQKLAFALRNEYDHDLELVKGEFYPADPRFSFVVVNPPFGLGKVHRSGVRRSATEWDEDSMLAGAVIFDPSKTCAPRCYLGINSVSSEGEQWVSSLTLPQDVADVDAGLLKPLIQRWQDLEAQNLTKTNLSAELYCSPMDEKVTLPIVASLEWPAMAKRSLSFNLVHVGQVATQKMELRNPANVPVVVQIIPVSLYQNVQKILKMLHESFNFEELEDVIDQQLTPENFFLTNSEERNKASNNPAIQYRADLEQKLSVRPSKETLTFVLQPQQHLSVSVTYNASDASTHQSVFMVRNNLTVVDLVTVSGVALSYSLTLDSVQPIVAPLERSQYFGGSLNDWLMWPFLGRSGSQFGSRIPSVKAHSTETSKAITFEFKQNYILDHCHGNSSLSFKMKKRRSLLLANTGSLAFSVSSILIDGVPCNNHGFFVENCDPLTGKVVFTSTNSSTVPVEQEEQLVITFHPDFALTKVETQLELFLDMELSIPKIFRLTATVPFTFLPKCAASVPRPPWEGYMYYAVVLSMITLFFAALITSYYDAKKLILHTYSQGTPAAAAALLCASARNNKEPSQVVVPPGQKTVGVCLASKSDATAAMKVQQGKPQVNQEYEAMCKVNEQQGDKELQEVSSFITQKSNPDGSRGFLLHFRTALAAPQKAQQTQASNEDVEKETVASRVAKSLEKLSAKRRTAVLQKQQTVAAQLQTNHKLLVSRQKPESWRFWTAFRKLYLINLTWAFLCCSFRTGFITIPIKLYSLVKKLSLIVLYTFLVFSATMRWLASKFVAALYNSLWKIFCVPRRKTVDTLTPSPIRKSQGTDTRSLNTGGNGKQKHKRGAHGKMNKNQRSIRYSKVSRDPSEEHSVATEEKGSPSISEAMDDETSLLSTPEARSRRNKSNREKSNVKTSAIASFMDNSSSSSRLNGGGESVTNLRSTPTGSSELEESVSGHSGTSMNCCDPWAGDFADVHSHMQFARRDDRQSTSCKYEHESHLKARYDSNTSTGASPFFNGCLAPTACSKRGRVRDVLQRSTSYDSVDLAPGDCFYAEKTTVPPGFEDYVTIDSMKRKSSAAIARPLTSNSRKASNDWASQHGCLQSGVNLQVGHKMSNNKYSIGNIACATPPPPPSKTSVDSIHAPLATAKGLADFRKEVSDTSPLLLCHHCMHMYPIGGSPLPFSPPLCKSPALDFCHGQGHDLASSYPVQPNNRERRSMTREEFHKGPSPSYHQKDTVAMGSSVHKPSVPLFSTEASAGGQSAIGPNLRKAAAAQVNNSVQSQLPLHSVGKEHKENGHQPCSSFSFFQNPHLPGVNFRDSIFGGSLEHPRRLVDLDESGLARFSSTGDGKYSDILYAPPDSCWPPQSSSNRGKGHSSRTISKDKEEENIQYHGATFNHNSLFAFNGESNSGHSSIPENTLMHSSSLYSGRNSSSWDNVIGHSPWDSKLAPLELLDQEEEETEFDYMQMRYSSKLKRDKEISRIWERKLPSSPERTAPELQRLPIGGASTGVYGAIGDEHVAKSLHAPLFAATSASLLWNQPMLLSPSGQQPWVSRRTTLPIAPFNKEDVSNSDSEDKEEPCGEKVIKSESV